MKKKVFVAAALLVVLAILATGTLAYFSAKAVTHNVITTDSVGIHVEEYQDEDGELKPYPEEPVDVMPGTEVSKIVLIRNDEAQSWIRACVEIVVTDAEGEQMLLTPAQQEKIITLSMNEEYWLRKSGDSKWWYYRDPVDTGKATQPLFTTVAFDGPAMGNEFQGSTFYIHIAGQAVQTANNAATVLTAVGWPNA